MLGKVCKRTNPLCGWLKTISPLRIPANLSCLSFLFFVTDGITVSIRKAFFGWNFYSLIVRNDYRVFTSSPRSWYRAKSAFAYLPPLKYFKVLVLMQRFKSILSQEGSTQQGVVYCNQVSLTEIDKKHLFRSTFSPSPPKETPLN